MLHLVEGTILQVLRHAHNVVALPSVNSGEQAAELPDLIRERAEKLRRENGNVGKNRRGFLKSICSYSGCALFVLDRLLNI